MRIYSIIAGLIFATAGLAQGTGPYGERVQHLNAAGALLTTAYYSVPPSGVNSIRGWDDSAKLTKPITSTSLSIGFSGGSGTIEVGSVWLENQIDSYVAANLGTSVFSDTGDFETPTGAQAKANAALSAANNYTDAAISALPAPFSGAYSALTGTPSTFTPSSHTHAMADVTGLSAALAGKLATPSGTTSDYLRGDGSVASFPSIPAAQVQTDWNAVSGLGVILNKPVLFSGAYSALTGTPSSFTPSAHTHSISDTTGLSSAIAAKFDNPTGTTAQYLRGDGTVATFPTIPTNTNQLTNGAGFITGVSSGDITSALGFTPYNATNPSGYVGQSGARSAISLTTTGSGAASYNSTTGVLNVPTPSAGGAGTVTSVGLSSSDLSITGSPVTSSGSFTANLNTSGVSAGTYSSVTVTNKGIVTSATNRSQASASRSLNSGFQISTTRDSLVNYSVDVSCTATLLGGQTGTVFLEVASDSGFTTNLQEVARSVNGNSVSLAIAITVIQNVTGTLTGYVPAGYYVRIRTANTVGTPTFSYRSGQEIQL